MHCIDCLRDFSETHRVEIRETGARVLVKALRCVACSGIDRLNRHRTRIGERLAAMEQRLTDEDIHRIRLAATPGAYDKGIRVVIGDK